MKLSDELIKRLIWLVKTSWNFRIRDWFFRDNSELLGIFRENTWWAAHFFLKKITIQIFEKKKKSTFFCLHLRLAKVPYGVRTPWYECLSFYIIIIIRHYFKHFTVSVFVNFCPICHHKNRTKNSKNFHCAFLFLSLYYPYLLQSLWRYSDFFFHTWIFY